MATPISRWFRAHVTDPLDRMYERIDAGLGIDPEEYATAVPPVGPLPPAEVAEPAAVMTPQTVIAS